MLTETLSYSATLNTIKVHKGDRQKKAHDYQDIGKSLAKIDFDRSSYSQPSYYSLDASYGDLSYKNSETYVYLISVCF